MANTFKVGIMGNRNENYEPHYAMNRSFSEFQQYFPIEFEWIPTQSLEQDASAILHSYNGLVVGSGPYQSKTGIINGIRYAREKNIPFLGTCSGFGYAVLEFGQSLFNLATVHHPYEDVSLQPNEIFLETLNECVAGIHPICFQPVAGTLVDKIYNHQSEVQELSHCVYGINRDMIAQFGREGFIVSATDDLGEPKIMEYAPNNFFVITLFLPQLMSTLSAPHPLLMSFFNTIIT